jgi:hypothetical protein
VLERLLASPFVLTNPSLQASRRTGLVKVLHWLEEHPGQSWQDRWIASGADAAGNTAWRHLASRWLQGTGWGYRDPRDDFITVGRGVLPLISGDAIRPGLAWLLTPETPKNLTEEMTRARDPGGFATLAALSDAGSANASTKQTALRRIAVMMAARGGTLRDIAVGDCLQLLDILTERDGRSDTSLYFYQLLHAAGVFPPSAPPTVRVFHAQGQLTAEQWIDRYDIACRPIRDLLVEYLRQRRPALDYATWRNVAVCLGKLFWKDLEVHHPSIASLRLSAEVAAAWKKRLATKETRNETAAGEVVEVESLRSDRGINYLSIVRAFYLDIAQWAMDDPAMWGPWAAPCPIRDEEMSFKKVRSHRKSHMDQRTRERLPVLPILASTVDAERKAAAERLQAARGATPGEVFTAGGQTLAAISHGRRNSDQDLGRRPRHRQASPSKNTGRFGPGPRSKYFATRGSSPRVASWTGAWFLAFAQLRGCWR